MVAIMLQKSSQIGTKQCQLLQNLKVEVEMGENSVMSFSDLVSAQRLNIVYGGKGGCACLGVA